MASRRLAISSLLCDDDDSQHTPSSETGSSPSFDNRNTPYFNSRHSPRPVFRDGVPHSPLPTSRRSAYQQDLSPSPPQTASPSWSTTFNIVTDIHSSSGRDRVSPRSIPGTSSYAFHPQQHLQQHYAPYTAPAHAPTPTREQYTYATPQSRLSASTSPYAPRPSSSHSPRAPRPSSTHSAHPPLSPMNVFHAQPASSHAGSNLAHHVPRVAPVHIQTSSLPPGQGAPFSALEALVQAADEERERIVYTTDARGHRRLSGGSSHGSGDERFSSIYGAMSVRGSHSPTLQRSDAHYQRSSPLPPMSLYPHSPQAHLQPQLQTALQPNPHMHGAHMDHHVQMDSSRLHGGLDERSDNMRILLNEATAPDFHADMRPRLTVEQHRMHAPSSRLSKFQQPPSLPHSGHPPAPSQLRTTPPSFHSPQLPQQEHVASPRSPPPHSLSLDYPEPKSPPTPPTPASQPRPANALRSTMNVQLTAPVLPTIDQLPTPIAVPVPVDVTSPLSVHILSAPGSGPCSTISIGSVAHQVGHRTPPRSKPKLKRRLPGSTASAAEDHPRCAPEREVVQPVPRRANGIDLKNLRDLKEDFKETHHVFDQVAEQQPQGVSEDVLERAIKQEPSAREGATLTSPDIIIKSQSHKPQNDTEVREEEEVVPDTEEQDAHDFFLSAFDGPPQHPMYTPSHPTRPRGPPSFKQKSSPDSSTKGGKLKTQTANIEGKRRKDDRMFSSSPVSAPGLALAPVLAEPLKTSSMVTPVLNVDRGQAVLPPRPVISSTPKPDAAIGPDVDGVLVAAVYSEDEADILGAAESSEAGDTTDAMDLDGEADTIEVDVEDELLSLIDDHPHPPRRSYAHDTLPASSAHQVPRAATFQVAERLPNAHLLASKATTIKKSKGRSGSVDADAKSGKKDNMDGVDATGYTIKKPARPRAKPATSGKSKAKQSKDKSAEHIGPSAPATSHPSLPPPFTTMTADPFPNVTSSGRMVTKTKKSAAGNTTARAGPSVVRGVIGSGSASPFPVPPPPTKESKRKSAVVAEVHEARSRSHSVMPLDPAGIDGIREKVDGEVAADAADSDQEDDKLYCVCKTKYDEDRVMIACDRCDEWYHTQCVNMPDLEVDLVDQFICPPCVARNPDLPIKTTYKPRCRSGLAHSNPDSADACHKPARGAFSKYCSDECGIRFMNTKIQAWTNKGGDVNRLWDSVKGAKRREGVVVCESQRLLPKAIEAEIKREMCTAVHGKNQDENAAPATSEGPTDGSKVDMADKVRKESERLKAKLRVIMREREEKIKEMEIIVWRERLLELATERAEEIAECGWDQRLCFGDEEWTEFGEGVLESYEDVGTRVTGAKNDHDDAGEAMEVDGQQDEEGEWWCRGEKKCARHVGWQKLRAAEVVFEKADKETSLAKLTTQERELRKRMEDLLDPHARNFTSPKAPFKPRLSRTVINEPSTKRAADGAVRKGKKKKTGSS